MTTTRANHLGVTRWDVAAKRAPIVLAAVGAASLIITPPIALYRDLKADIGGLSEQVEANTVGIARLEERMDNVEAGLIRLEGKVDQVLFILAGKDVAQPWGHEYYFPFWSVVSVGCGRQACTHRLSGVGAASLIITPPVALYRDLKADLGGLSEQVKESTVGIARLEERMDNVEAGLQEVKDGLNRLEGKVDQLILHLMGTQGGQP